MFRLLCLALLACASGHAALARAAERHVSFADAIALAASNPRLLAGEQAASSLQSAAERAPALDANPAVTMSAGPRLTPSNERGFEGALGVSQSLSLEGSVGLRKQALQAEAAWLRGEVAAETLERRVAAASAWLGLWEAQETMRVADDDVANEQALLQLIEKLARVQERSAADVATVQARVAEALLRQRMAEGLLAEARAQLAAELRSAAQDVLIAEGGPPELAAPSPEDQARMLAAAGSLPDIRARLLLARAELVHAREERAARGLRLSLGAELRHDALGANIIQGTLAVPLPLFAVGEREHAARQAQATRLHGEAADAKLRARAALLLAFHEVEHTQEVLVLLDAQLLPAAEHALSLRSRELSLGEGTLLEVIDARRTLFDARIRHVGALRDRAWARIHIQLLSSAMTATP